MTDREEVFAVGKRAALYALITFGIVLVIGVGAGFEVDGTLRPAVVLAVLVFFGRYIFY